MRIAVIIFSDYENHQSKGVAKKIKGEIAALEQLGHIVTLVYRHEDTIVYVNGTDYKKEKIKKGVTKYRNAVCRNILKKVKNREIDMIFVRYPGSVDPSLYGLFKQSRPYLSKSVLEMPTYPIGYEMLNRYKSLFTVKSFWRVPYYSLAYGMHLILSRRLYRWVDCVLSYFSYDKIWNMDVINVDNGIELNEISLLPKKNNQESLVIIFVAAFAVWHGVDRLIKGLYNYYRTKDDADRDVELILVGKGEELDKAIQTEEFAAIREHVTLTGALFGEELENQYNKAHIGMSSIGMHRIGMTIGSTLKTKEYMAKGLPFVYAYTEKEISDEFPYALRIPADESDVRIPDIISFYEGIKDSDYNNEMREFASRYDWKEQMSRFMSFVEKR